MEERMKALEERMAALEAKFESDLTINQLVSEIERIATRDYKTAYEQLTPNVKITF